MVSNSWNRGSTWKLILARLTMNSLRAHCVCVCVCACVLTFAPREAHSPPLGSRLSLWSWGLPEKLGCFPQAEPLKSRMQQALSRAQPGRRPGKWHLPQRVVQRNQCLVPTGRARSVPILPSPFKINETITLPWFPRPLEKFLFVAEILTSLLCSILAGTWSCDLKVSPFSSPLCPQISSADFQGLTPFPHQSSVFPPKSLKTSPFS